MINLNRSVKENRVHAQVTILIMGICNKHELEWAWLHTQKLKYKVKAN